MDRLLFQQAGSVADAPSGAERAFDKGRCSKPAVSTQATIAPFLYSTAVAFCCGISSTALTKI